MKEMSSTMKQKKYTMFLCLLFSLYSSLIAEQNTITIAESNNAYYNALQQSHPSLLINKCSYSSASRIFSNGKNIAAFETEAAPLASAHSKYIFSPHYIQTVVIVIDRNQTSEKIEGWNDIIQSKLPINFMFGKKIGKMVWNTPSNYHIVTSMAQALYGSYDIHAISKDFRKIHTEDRFFTNDDSLPISVMYDSQAVKLLEQARNIEIIFPKEGTQSFVAGILHTQEITFNTEILNEALLDKGFRLLNGNTNSLYPNKEYYGNIPVIKDFEKYNKAIATIDTIMRRESFDIQRYGFANTKERTTGYIICIIILVIYMVSLNVRLTQKNIKKALIIVCSLELLLASTQYIKALVSNMPNLETFLWYAFYFSFIMIPTIFMYVAVITGKQQNQKVPLLYKLYFCFSLIAILFVATNNMHKQVFDIYDYYHSYFNYNWGYYCVMGWIYVSISITLGILLQKSFRNPRKWAFLLPVISGIFTLLYTIGVVLRIPIARDFEVGYGTGIVLLLFMETCIQSRLFPINRGYKKLFTKSSLQMEILDSRKVVVFKSENTAKKNANLVPRESFIAGGSFLFYEDYTELNATKEKLINNNNLLEKNNTILQEQNKVQSELAALSVQKEIYNNIDTVLIRDTKKISNLLESMKNSKNSRRIISYINIIACGIKRDCILRINTLYKKTQATQEFLNYIHEMSEFTEMLPLQITIGSNAKNELPVKHALVMYEVFRIFIENAAFSLCENVVIQLYDSQDAFVFSLISNKDITQEIDILDIQKHVESQRGTLITKPLEDTTSFILSFNKEEVD